MSLGNFGGIDVAHTYTRQISRYMLVTGKSYVFGPADDVRSRHARKESDFKGQAARIQISGRAAPHRGASTRAACNRRGQWQVQ